MTFPPSVPGDSFANTTASKDVLAPYMNQVSDGLTAILAELGSSPKGVATDLTARLARLDLSVTAVKTSTYSAAVGDLIPVDASGGSVIVNLPAAPADHARVGVKMIATAGSNTVTINRGGSTDVFNKAGGSTSLVISTLNQGFILQYDHATGIWYASDSVSLAQLDLRYAPITGSSSYAPLSAAWVTGGVYTVGQLVTNAGLLYRTTTAHTAGVSFDATKFTVVGAAGLTVVSKTTTYTAVAGDLILADATSGAFTITAPVLTAAQTFTVKKVDSSVNAVTVVPTSGTVDGGPSVALISQYQSRAFVGDGTNLYLV